MFGSKKWDARGKRCLVTGGSSGLGLETAILLARKGAHVTVAARNEAKLKAAIELLEKARQSPEQVFRYHHDCALNSLSGATAVIEAECEANDDGSAPDAFFFCAGSSHPQFWVEATEEHLMYSMDQAYWIQAWSALAASKILVRKSQKAEIVFVGSTLSCMGFIGYAPYAPGKHALKGLAETLRSELLLYGIGVHIFFPPTMPTPGFENEQKTKPKITMEIESGDSPVTGEAAAQALLNGIERGYYQVAGNLQTDLFAASSRGSGPVSKGIYYALLDFVAWIATPIWRGMTDKKIVASRSEHQAYLSEIGLVQN